MNLSTAHRDYLLAAAITEEVIEASGITTRETEPTGIVFPWNDGTLEEAIPQLRPDNPRTDAKGKTVKYLFPKGARMVLNRLRDTGEGPALITEGTKQQYAALSHAPADFAVYGLSGCWNWTDADLTWAMGRDVYVLFDGDLLDNPDVHKAAAGLNEQLDLNGAASVRFVRTTARGTDGLDDVLARLPEDKRAQYFGLWISKALAKLPKAPSAKPASPFFDKATGFQVQKAAHHLLEEQPAALTAERNVALYLGGSYHIDGTAFMASVSKLLGDQYRPAWRAAMEEVTTGILFESGKILPERNSFVRLNCKNGMLDLRTLELTDHSPEFMSTVQVPVEWDPDARAPRYEAWLARTCPLQMDDLEEVAGTMLDPTRTPPKAAFLFGPSRSGKSTMLRLMQEIAGVENRTAVTLHDLTRDRFAAANVYGKILNAAADLSSAHVEDLSVFKMMTGEDPVHGNRKYGAQFTFTNQALFAFSANELPTVSESSRAYAERIKPFEFPYSFAGKEDLSLEGHLRKEIPGILVRWVKAYQRVLQRGGYQQTHEAVRREFETRSDRVAQWVSDVCLIIEALPGQEVPETKCTGRRESARAFNAWAERNGGSKMGERKIFDRLGQIPGVVEVRTGRNRARAFNIVVKDDPNADLRVSPPGSRESMELRAERAVSEHPSHTTSTPIAPGTALVDLGGEGKVKVHGEGASKLPVLPGPLGLGFDLETADAKELYRGQHEGPFVRLFGLAYDDADKYIEASIEPSGHYPPAPYQCSLDQLNDADEVYGANIMAFDLPALAFHHGADYDALAAKAVDLTVRERLVDPPMSKGGQSYKLDDIAHRYGVPGKTHDLMALARKYGGLDKIPVDDRDYQDYLRGDLASAKAVKEAQDARVKEMGLEDYAVREMRVAHIQNRISLNGWKVDTELLAERVGHEAAQRADAVKVLNEEFGVPLAKPDRFKLLPKKEWPQDYRDILSVALAREGLKEDPERSVEAGLAVRIPGEVSKKPWTTTEGQEALVKAFADAGAPHVPRSPAGTLRTSSDAMGEVEWYDKDRRENVKGMLQVYGHIPQVRRIVDHLMLATGARDKYAEVAGWVCPDGRVHAKVGAAQGSGRWAYTEPSLTNMGKHGAAGAERAIMIADGGQVLLTCDASQVDMRAVAGLSQDPAYMELFQPGRDAHMDMAEVYFGARTPEFRQRTKRINHKLNYGGGVDSTSKMEKIPREIVQQAYDARTEAYPRLMEWIQEVRDLAASGTLLDNGFGRLMRPDPERAATQGPALMGQGAARDIVCESLLRLVDLDRRVLDHLRGFVHDEVILSVPQDEVEYWSQVLEDAFTWEWRGVPILCEVGKPSLRWSDCK